MTKILRLQVISVIIAQPEFFDDIDIGMSQVVENIDSHVNPTSSKRISGIIAHRVHDVISG